jgi:UDP-N-acetylmuramoyl-L-alanyl-D-glutamate--2,6-diaminopimelate ligase
VKLKDLLKAIGEDIFLSNENLATHPALDLEVKRLSTNSRACESGTLFIGIPGTQVDGGDYWESAISGGAIAAIVSFSSAQKAFDSGKTKGSCIIPVHNPALVCGKAASIFSGSPTEKLKMIGVTGTNGKTTTTHLIEFLLNQAHQTTAILGTLYTRWPGYQKTAAYTTPFAIELQEQLSKALQAGCKYVAMEVSSHALDQGRVLGCFFDVAVFTNLTQDHLDYHKTMENYFNAKSLLFDIGYLRGRAIINKDDIYGGNLISSLIKDKVWSYSVSDSTSDLWTSDVVYGPSGVYGNLHTPVGVSPFEFPLVGHYNVQNLLAALGAVLHLGVPLDVVVNSFSNSHYGKSGRIMGKMKSETIKHEREKMLPAIKINVTS